MLLVDLDHFKRINDGFGHGMGDRVLAKTGDALREVLRPLPGEAHCAARMGGEEFAVLLPGADAKAAAAIAELLRLRIAAIGHDIGDSGPDVSASIGTAAFGNAAGIATALEAADMALYEAKTSGRNRVVARAA